MMRTVKVALAVDEDGVVAESGVRMHVGLLQLIRKCKSE